MDPELLDRLVATRTMIWVLIVVLVIFAIFGLLAITREIAMLQERYKRQRRYRDPDVTDLVTVAALDSKSQQLAVALTKLVREYTEDLGNHDKRTLERMSVLAKELESSIENMDSELASASQTFAHELQKIDATINELQAASSDSFDAVRDDLNRILMTLPNRKGE